MTDPDEVKTHEIDSREQLVAFIQRLVRDYESNAEAWENRSIGKYLDAL